MTDKEILEKAIQKAIDGGWAGAYPNQSDVSHLVLWAELNNWKVIKVLFSSIVGETTKDVSSVIYNHQFTKALWGEKFINPEYTDDTGSQVIGMHRTAWKHHLQQMVISDDPIQYLKDNI